MSPFIRFIAWMALSLLILLAAGALALFATLLPIDNGQHIGRLVTSGLLRDVA